MPTKISDADSDMGLALLSVATFSVAARAGRYPPSTARHEHLGRLRAQPGAPRRGDFDTNLTRLSGSWNLNPLTSFIGNIQYDDVSRVVGLFARARWIVRPGSEVFFVWTHNWRNEPELPGSPGFTTLSRGRVLKVNYSYRF